MSNLARALMTMNTSGLHPLGRAVLVEPIETELATKNIIVPDNVRERSMMMEVYATVIEVGPEAWKEERVPRAVPGDRVMVSKWCGHITHSPLNKRKYRFVNAEDVFCGIDKEVNFHG